MVKRDVFIALPLRSSMIKEHGDPDTQGWFVLFFMSWIAVTIIWNYVTTWI